MGHLRSASWPRWCGGGSGPDATRLSTRGSVRRAASRTAAASGHHPTDSRGEARELMLYDSTLSNPPGYSCATSRISLRPTCTTACSRASRTSYVSITSETSRWTPAATKSPSTSAKVLRPVTPRYSLPPPEVLENVQNVTGVTPAQATSAIESNGQAGNLQLSSQEEADLVNFLKILNDGYTTPNPVSPGDCFPREDGCRFQLNRKTALSRPSHTARERRQIANLCNS